MPTAFSCRRHDNDAERISDISVAPTAGEILCERPPYVPRNAPSTWDGMDHLKVRLKRNRSLAVDTGAQSPTKPYATSYEFRLYGHIFGRISRRNHDRPSTIATL